MLARASDTDGKGLTVQTTNYQRKVHCERIGSLDAADIGALTKGSYPRISCLTTASDQRVERRSEYVWLPQHGIFLLLAFRQKGDNLTTPTDNPGELAVKGNLLSFEALPMTD